MWHIGVVVEVIGGVNEESDWDKFYGIFLKYSFSSFTSGTLLSILLRDLYWTDSE
jgi:hypothetical protein